MCTARTHTVPAVERERTAPTHVRRWHGEESLGQLSATRDLASLAARGQAGREGSAYANASVRERVALRVLLRMCEWQECLGSEIGVGTWSWFGPGGDMHVID
jgi:uncharacterized protein YfaQ (DUF2300 family)